MADQVGNVVDRMLGTAGKTTFKPGKFAQQQIAMTQTPEYKAEKARKAEEAERERAEREALEAAERERQSAEQQARIEARSIEMSRTARLYYADSCKRSNIKADEGQRFDVVDIHERGAWRVNFNGCKLLVPFDLARPCDPETKNDLERADAPASAGEALPAQSIAPAPAPDAEALGEGWPWWWGKSDAAIRALLEDKLITIQGAVFLCLVCPCPEHQWPIVWRDRESIAEALGLTERKVSTAIEALVKHGYIVKVGGGRNKQAARYKVLRFAL